MTKQGKWVIGCSTILLVVVLGTSFLLYSFFSVENEFEDEKIFGKAGSSKIAIIELKDEIFESENIVRQLKKYGNNENIDAIVLRVNSPGGDVAASQEIFEEVKKVREIKPIITSFGSVAASGGYYVALGSTKIVSNPGSVTGSIGVISQYMNLEELLSKVGIHSTTIKSGKFKDSGSLFREMTEDEKKYLQETIDDVYIQFINVVSFERNISLKKVKELANGKIYTGQKAFELGLVDTIGTFEDAISIAANLSGIIGEPTIVKERKTQKLMDYIFNDVQTKIMNQAINLVKPSVLQYKFQY
ncbi:MAG: signal peptide peptidase SppA [Bacteroidetes bacterium]|nr:signal peptide peptidase SppA [Bacteroidota bacterium]